MTSFVALDGVTSFWRLKNVTNTRKQMRRSLSIGGSSSVQWRKVERSWSLQMCFRPSLCVRIEIDQLQCVNCRVIIHCLSVSCTKINHSRYALVIWSSLQLTSKQWIITQQFTARADLFLKWYSFLGPCQHSSTLLFLAYLSVRVRSESFLIWFLPNFIYGWLLYNSCLSSNTGFVRQRMTKMANKMVAAYQYP